MVVQMVRFFWKKSNANTGSEATKAKILRVMILSSFKKKFSTPKIYFYKQNVTFPKILDVYQFCSDDLKKSIDQGKEYEKKKIEERNKVETDKFEEYKRKLEAEGKIVPEDSKELFKKYKEQMIEETTRLHDENLYRKHGLGLDNGNYQLIGVLTHKGRTADSGHYVAWIHRSGGKK